MVPGLASVMLPRISCDDVSAIFDSDSYLQDNLLDSEDLLGPHFTDCSDDALPVDPCATPALFGILDNMWECTDCGTLCNHLTCTAQEHVTLLDNIKTECVDTEYTSSFTCRAQELIDSTFDFLSRESAETVMVNPQAVLPLQVSYSPLTDHSYYQTIGYSDDRHANDEESESQSDDSADEIDVETVPEIKVEPQAIKVLKRRGRKPAAQKATVPKVQLNRRTTMKRTRNIQLGRSGYRRRKAFEPSSASSSDVEELEKRSSHNTTERLRRDYQKRMLQELRSQIPSVKNNIKAPKVMILREATKYCHVLTNNNEHCETTKVNLEKKFNVLKRRFDQLKKQLTLQ